MTDKFQWGPGNPHPLSLTRTELVWEGKYDEYGRRREVDVAGHAMPLQKIETVDEPRSQAFAAGNLELFERKRKKTDDFRNLLIWGDNKLVMASLLKDFKGKVDLIYIDPPFDVGADFTMDVPIGDGNETVAKDQSTLEMVAYRDMWGKGTDSYIHMMYERLTLMKDLLKPEGNLYVHIDSRVVHYLRAICDEVFGTDCLRNEIIWCYRGGGTPDRAFAAKHDTILRYSISDKSYFDVDSVRIPYSEASKERLEHRTNVFRGDKVYEDYQANEAGKHPEDWWTIQPIMPSEKMERVDYPTQKPVELIQRIIDSSCPKDGIVLDAYVGSGTTAAVAEGLRVGRDAKKKPGSDKYLYLTDSRRWIGIDFGRFAIHTSRKRLIELQRALHAESKPYRAFDVYNLGRYERQWWQKDRLQGADEEHRRVVLEFFKAEVLANAPSPLLHGRKAGAFCYVESIDSIFTRDEARRVADAVAQAGGRELYCLAWEFEMDLRVHTAALEQELGVRMKLIPIPREIMEKNRKSPPPFLEMAVLEAEPVRRKKGGKSLVDVKLTRFLPSLAEVPTKELEALKERAVKSGFDFIDFWAVDFEWAPGKPFNHHWQDYRTRKDRSLRTVSDAGYEYPKPGKHMICVKVVDVFGCDTSITFETEA
jgi:adenine-specific DNA-methyltransferase